MNDFRPVASANFVWILSHSRAALRRVHSLLFETESESSDPTPRIRPNLLFDYADTAFVSPVAEELARELANRPGLCAAILVIEPEALVNPLYIEWATWCCREVAKRDDFRLFVRLDGLEMAEVVQRARTESGLLADLRDTVQIAESPDNDRLPEDLAQYLADIGAIREAANWRAAKTELATAAGAIAALIQIVASVSFVALSFSVLTGVESTRVATIPKDIVGLISGILLFPLATILIFFVSRGSAMANIILAQNPWLSRWVIVAVSGFSLTWRIHSTLGFSTSWLVSGIAVGVLLDVMRRRGRQAARAKLVLDGCAATPHDRSLPYRVEEASRGSPPSPLIIPLFPPNPTRIFISYARASQWCRDKAIELYDALHSRGVTVFLDREGIPEGGNWRRRLNLKLAESNVIICLADQLSIEREWVAAELETALAGVHWTGLPEIILLVHAGVTRPPTEAAYPAFRALLTDESAVQQPGEPRRITVKASTVATVASMFDQFSSAGGAVFPGRLAWIYRRLMGPLTRLGPYGQAFGKLGGLLCVLQWTGVFTATSRLESMRLLGPLTLLFSYWMGYMLSLALASRYEVQAAEEVRRTNVASHNLAFIGFACWVGTAAPHLAPIWWGWLVVCAGLGWFLGWDFVRVVAMVRADFRPRDL